MNRKSRNQNNEINNRPQTTFELNHSSTVKSQFKTSDNHKSALKIQQCESSDKLEVTQLEQL